AGLGSEGRSGMPLYEYQCDACGRRFELIRKFSDPPVETCPHCGGHVQKLMSSPAIQFKGSGFYITDYAKKSNAPAGDSQGSKSSGEKKDWKESGGSKETEKPSTETKSSESNPADPPASKSSSSASDPKP